MCEIFAHVKKKQYFCTRFRENEAFMVVLAQLVEHRIVVPSVVGSSPTFHPKTAEIPFGIAAVFFAWHCRSS